MKTADETAETTALKALIEEAIQNGDVLSILPDDIKAQLPEGITTVAETITLTLANYDPETMGAVTVKIQPKGPTKYGANDRATVLIALPDGNDGYIWFLIEGIGQADGTLDLNIPADTARQLAGKTFVTLIME